MVIVGASLSCIEGEGWGCREKAGDGRFRRGEGLGGVCRVGGGGGGGGGRRRQVQGRRRGGGRRWQVQGLESCLSLLLVLLCSPVTVLFPTCQESCLSRLCLPRLPSFSLVSFTLQPFHHYYYTLHTSRRTEHGAASSRRTEHGAAAWACAAYHYHVTETVGRSVGRLVGGHSKSRNGKWEMRNGKSGNGEMERQRTSFELV